RGTRLQSVRLAQSDMGGVALEPETSRECGAICLRPAPKRRRRARVSRAPLADVRTAVLRARARCGRKRLGARRLGRIGPRVGTLDGGCLHAAARAQSRTWR